MNKLQEQHVICNKSRSALFAISQSIPYIRIFPFHRENIEEELEERWKIVQHQIETHGTYNLDEKELVYGARLAWRNAARCIGRIQWKKLQVTRVSAHLNNRTFSKQTMDPT